ncbi:MAG: hypothetical protein WB474_00230 [Nitrososphaeraceae archaeon]
MDQNERRQTSESNSSLHYCIIEGENEHDNTLVKNLQAHHDILIVKKADRLYGNFTPENKELQSVKIFLTKSFKIKTDHLISGKKYNLKNVQCGHSGCTTFRADIPSNINKRTYQLVVWTFQDELQKLYISKAVVE